MDIVTRLFLHDGQQSPPRTGLLLYLRTPNGTGAAAGKYVATAGSASIFAALGSDWYTDVATPKALTAAEILALASVNDYHILFSVAKGLAVYDPYTTTQVTIDKAHRFYKVTVYQDDVPSAFFNGMDFRLATYTGGPTYVADNLGVLRSPGANIPACEGFRLVTTVEDGAVLGPELVTNGGFDTDLTGWTNVPGGSSISYVDGECLVDITGIAGGITSSLPISMFSGRKYRVSFNYHLGTYKASLRINYNGSSVGCFETTLGYNTKSIDFIASGNYTSFNIGRNIVATGTIYFDNISIREVIPTYYDTAADGTPLVSSRTQKTRTGSADFSTFTPAETYKRYAIDNPKLLPGWLCEPARTNYTLNSEDITLISIKRGTVVSNIAEAPNKTITADKVVVDTQLGGHYFFSSDVTVSAGLVYTFSLYVKKAERKNILVFCGYVSGSDGILPDKAVNIDLEYGLAVASENSPNYTVSYITNGWYKITLTATAIATGTAKFSALLAPNGNRANVFYYHGTDTGDGVSGLYAWGLQYEQGPFATSYIPTTTAAATRAGTVNTYPAVGKIPVNDFALRIIVVPRATGQSGVYLFGSYVDASNYTAIIIAPTALTIRKRISGINTDATVSLTHGIEVPIDLVLSMSTVGMQLSARTFSTTWAAFTDGTLNSTEAAKANAPIGTTYQLGALNGASQFTGNISLFDCVPIPAGTTDPMAWAKTHWGVA